jgi:hypothetical protein
MKLQQQIARASDAIERVAVRSALNPMLWLCGLVTIPTLLVATFVSDPPMWLVVLGLSPVGATIIGFLYLLFRDPDKLQSESYQLRKQALELIEEKGDPRIIDATAVALVSNPELPALPPPEKEVAE